MSFALTLWTNRAIFLSLDEHYYTRTRQRNTVLHLPGLKRVVYDENSTLDG